MIAPFNSDFPAPLLATEVIEPIKANFHSKNTQLAYKIDTDQFDRYSWVKDSPALQSYVGFLVANGYTWNSIVRKIATVKDKYSLVDKEKLKFIKGTKRLLLEKDSSKIFPEQATPISKEDLTAIATTLLQESKGKAARDRALIWLVFLPPCVFLNWLLCKHHKFVPLKAV